MNAHNQFLESHAHEGGVVVEATKSDVHSFVPESAIKNSELLRRIGKRDDDHDPFSDDRVATHQPTVDSSDETLGG